MVDFKQNKLPKCFSDIYQSNKSTQIHHQIRQSKLFYEKRCDPQIFGINGPKSSKKPILIAISRQE